MSTLTFLSLKPSSLKKNPTETTMLDCFHFHKINHKCCFVFARNASKGLDFYVVITNIDNFKIYLNMFLIPVNIGRFNFSPSNFFF